MKQQRLPVRVIHHLQDEVTAAMDLIDPGLKFTVAGHVVQQRRGSAYQSEGMFTVPLWAYKRSPDYFIYYVAHEISHLLAGVHGHGLEFYRKFKRLCPVDFQHHEIEYKPRLAKLAGISEKQITRIDGVTTSNSGSMDSMAKNMDMMKSNPVSRKPDGAQGRGKTMKIYHVGALEHNGNLVIEACRNKDLLSCELLEYYGEREITKSTLKKNAFMFLNYWNQAHPDRKYSKVEVW